MVRKGSVKDANAELVQNRRVNDTATDQEIQDALHQLLNSRPRGNQGPEGHSILSEKIAQVSIQSTNENARPQGTETRHTVVVATAISKIRLDNQFKNYLYYFLQHEIPYIEILEELSGGTRQVRKNDLIFKRMNGCYLYIIRTRILTWIFGEL